MSYETVHFPFPAPEQHAPVTETLSVLLFRWVICKNRAITTFSAPPPPNRKKSPLSCFSNLILTVWNKGAFVVVTKQWHFSFLSLSKFPVSSPHWRAICLSWGFRGASAHSGPISLTTLLLAVSRASRQMNLPTVQQGRGFFSGINLINILIMNLDDGAIRSSGFQASASVVSRLWDWGSSGFRSCHPRGSASYQRLTHSLGNFLCVVIKWRLSDCKWLCLRGACQVSGERDVGCSVSPALCRAQQALNVPFTQQNGTSAES